MVVSSSAPASSGSVVESTGKLKRDWWKLLELLGVLIFETIGLVLLIGIIAVGQVESSVRIVEKRLRETAPKVEHKRAEVETRKSEQRATNRKNRRKRSRNKSREQQQQQETMGKEGYRRLEGMMTFPDLAVYN